MVQRNLFPKNQPESIGRFGFASQHRTWWTEADVENQPLLIDGLVGTGKTAVLSRRAAFRAGYANRQQNFDDFIKQWSCKTSSTRRFESCSKWAVLEEKQAWFFPWPLHNSFHDNEITNSTELTNRWCGRLPQIRLWWSIAGRVSWCHPPRVWSSQNFREIQWCSPIFVRRHPLQTLNPTGFDWGRIKSLFVNSIGQHKDESEQRSIAKQIMISKFHQNYRSQGDIVTGKCHTTS